MSVESIVRNKEFEQIAPYETERKFIPLFPEQLEELRQYSRPIEQFYLSHPDEQFSLRLREEMDEYGGLNYIATLKDAGYMVAGGGIRRLEVEVALTADDYAFYKDAGLPLVRKMRAEPMEGIAVDFYDDGSVRLESESPTSWEQFVNEYGDMFMEVTGDKSATNEWLAHLNFRRANNGAEALKPIAELNPADIVNDILRNMAPGSTTSVHIAGRSGSGKSTIVRTVQAQLESLGVQSIVLSTDDYHRGATWLTSYNNGQPWTAWDEAIVYDTKTMAADIAELHAGRPVYKRRIDFTDCEPKVDGILQPAPVVIIEGIYATSADVTTAGGSVYEMTTPLATCIGRRLIRDMRERPSFADPATSLHYMVTQAEPAYRAQQN